MSEPLIEIEDFKTTVVDMRYRAVKATQDSECFGSLRNCELALSVIDKADKILERLSNG